MSEQRALDRAALPLTDDQMAALLRAVDQAVERFGCESDLRHTRGWLEREAVAPNAVVTWLQGHGGYCDCEVVVNAWDAWEETRERGPR